MISFCHVTSRDQMVKRTCDSVSEPLNLTHHGDKLDAYLSREGGDIPFLFCQRNRQVEAPELNPP